MTDRGAFDPGPSGDRVRRHRSASFLAGVATALVCSGWCGEWAYRHEANYRALAGTVGAMVGALAVMVVAAALLVPRRLRGFALGLLGGAGLVLLLAGGYCLVLAKS